MTENTNNEILDTEVSEDSEVLENTETSSNTELSEDGEAANNGEEESSPEEGSEPSTEGEDNETKKSSTDSGDSGEDEESSDPIVMPEFPEPEIPEDTNAYRVYALVNSNGHVISINSDAFLTDGSTGWVKIDEGIGDRYHHAQNNYMDKPLWCEGGPARYKYVDGEIVERSQEEIDEEIASFPEPEETNEDLLMETAADHEYRICLLELGITEEDLTMLWEE